MFLKFNLRVFLFQDNISWKNCPPSLTYPYIHLCCIGQDQVSVLYFMSQHLWHQMNDLKLFFFFQHYQFVTRARWQSMASTLGIYLDRGGFLGVMCREQWELCTQPCSKKIYVYETLDTTIAKSNAENQWWDRSFSMSSGIAGRQV